MMDAAVGLEDGRRKGEVEAARTSASRQGVARAIVRAPAAGPFLSSSVADELRRPANMGVWERKGKGRGGWGRVGGQPTCRELSRSASWRSPVDLRRAARPRCSAASSNGSDCIKTAACALDCQGHNLAQSVLALAALRSISAGPSVPSNLQRSRVRRGRRARESLLSAAGTATPAAQTERDSVRTLLLASSPATSGRRLCATAG